MSSEPTKHDPLPDQERFDFEDEFDGLNDEWFDENDVEYDWSEDDDVWLDDNEDHE